MAKAPKTMTTGVEVDKAQVASMRRAYASYVREVERETERSALQHAQSLVPALKGAAAARGRQAALAAQSVRLTSTSPPTISAGGSVAVHPSDGHRVQGGDVFFGTEFGSSLNRRFTAPRTRAGWWYLPTIGRAASRLRDRYRRDLEKAARGWGSGG